MGTLKIPRGKISSVASCRGGRRPVNRACCPSRRVSAGGFPWGARLEPRHARLRRPWERPPSAARPRPTSCPCTSARSPTCVPGSRRHLSRRRASTGYVVTLHLTQRILALTGPCGAGKTSTIRALAHRDALDFDLVEWENQDSFYDAGEQQSAIDRFAAFLHHAQRYPALQLAPRHAPRPQPKRRKIVLVEDLPNLAHEATRAQFHQVLEHALTTPATHVPIVLIVSDSVPRAEDDAAAVVGAASSWRARREAQMDVRTVVPELSLIHI